MDPVMRGSARGERLPTLDVGQWSTIRGSCMTRTMQVRVEMKVFGELRQGCSLRLLS